MLPLALLDTLALGVLALALVLVPMSLPLRIIVPVSTKEGLHSPHTNRQHGCRSYFTASINNGVDRSISSTMSSHSYAARWAACLTQPE